MLLTVYNKTLGPFENIRFLAAVVRRPSVGSILSACLARKSTRSM